MQILIILLKDVTLSEMNEIVEEVNRFNREENEEYMIRDLGIENNLKRSRIKIVFANDVNFNDRFDYVFRLRDYLDSKHLYSYIKSIIVDMR